MRHFPILSALFVILVLAGCAIPFEIAPTDLSSVRTGSSQDAIEKVLGKPSSVAQSGSLKVANYSYDQGVNYAGDFADGFQFSPSRGDALGGFIGLAILAIAAISTPIRSAAAYAEVDDEQKGKLTVVYDNEGKVLAWATEKNYAVGAGVKKEAVDLIFGVSDQVEKSDSLMVVRYQKSVDSKDELPHVAIFDSKNAIVALDQDAKSLPIGVNKRFIDVFLGKPAKFERSGLYKAVKYGPLLNTWPRHWDVVVIYDGDDVSIWAGADVIFKPLDVFKLANQGNSHAQCVLDFSKSKLGSRPDYKIPLYCGKIKTTIDLMFGPPKKNNQFGVLKISEYQHYPLTWSSAVTIYDDTGKLIWVGIFVRSNTAIKMLRFAKDGDVYSQNWLAASAVSEKQKWYWACMAANQASPQGQYILGKMFEERKPVEYFYSYFWYGLAEANGHSHQVRDANVPPGNHLTKDQRRRADELIDRLKPRAECDPSRPWSHIDGVALGRSAKPRSSRIYRASSAPVGNPSNATLAQTGMAGKPH